MAEVGVPVVFNTLPDVQNDAIEVGLPKLILRDTETARLLKSRRTVKSVKNFHTWIWKKKLRTLWMQRWNLKIYS